MTLPSITKLFHSDALYILWHAHHISYKMHPPPAHMQLHTHTHTHKQKTAHSHPSPSRISWPSPPWRVSGEGPSMSPSNDRTSSWSRAWQLVSLSSSECRPGDVAAAPPASHSLLWQPASLSHLLWGRCHTQSHYTGYFPATASKHKQPPVPLSPTPAAH